MKLMRFLRPIGRVTVTDDQEIRFTLEGKELVVVDWEYIIRDNAWFVRLMHPTQKEKRA